jgi:hypothetical protein
MNTSGDAAEQIVRMSLETGEAALKISGAGAQQLAVLLYAVLKEQKKTRGRARMETMVRSGKPLTVFSVKRGDLKQFVREAKRYGVLYCAIQNPRGSSDGLVDIMVKEEDAPRINRIVERFRLASVKVEPEHRKEKEPGKDIPRQPEDALAEDALAAELLGTKDGQKEGKGEPVKNPPLAETGKTRLSEPISGRQGGTGAGTSKAYEPVALKKPSVREALKETGGAAGRKEPGAVRKWDAPGLYGEPGSKRHKEKTGKAKER